MMDSSSGLSWCVWLAPNGDIHYDDRVFQLCECNRISHDVIMMVIADNIRDDGDYEMIDWPGVYKELGALVSEARIASSEPEAPIPDVPGQGMLFEEVDA